MLNNYRKLKKKRQATIQVGSENFLNALLIFNIEEIDLTMHWGPYRTLI